MKNALFGILSILFLFSCSTEQKKESTTKDKTVEIKKADCSYSVMSEASASVNWTAFKFNEKVGVGGSFDKVSISGNKNMSTKVTDILNGTRFIIMTESINSKNPERDAKIVKSFFGTMVNTPSINGQIQNAKGTNNVGKCEALVVMNEVEKTVDLDYKIKGDKVTLTGSLNVNNWNGQGAIAALNEVCSLLHKGADGKSKLWPDVDLKIETTLKVTCPE